MSDTMTVVLENTSSRVEVSLVYSVDGAEIIEHPVYKLRRLKPISARFTFVDGDLCVLYVNSYILRDDDSVSDRAERVPNLRADDQSKWPEWLHEAYKLAIDDFNSTMKRWA